MLVRAGGKGANPFAPLAILYPASMHALHTLLYVSFYVIFCCFFFEVSRRCIHITATLRFYSPAHAAPEAVLSFARPTNADGKLQDAFLAGSELCMSGLSVQGIKGIGTTKALVL